ncbi:MAG: hypothetical protein QF824_04180 [Candidatus Woesearchaeota archaeon]|jgi:hypothetical protein|nr:hypothetical protein [Candidatus Woesearchaeota archaeon]
MKLEKNNKKLTTTHWTNTLERYLNKDTISRNMKKEVYFQNMIVHAWDINIYVKLDKEIRGEITKLIIRKYKSFNNFQSKVSLGRKSISALCKGGFSNILKIIELTNHLNLEKNYIEEHIELFRDSKTGAYNRTYQNIFPLTIDPKIIRIVSHVIGDGSICDSGYRYGQKAGVQCMNSLILSLIKPNGDLTIKDYHRFRRGKYEFFQDIRVPMIFVKVVAFCLNINIQEINSELFLEKLLVLPKEYRIQALVALYVDEGAISTKSIRMVDRKIIEAIAKIIDSLGYKRGKVNHKRWKGYCFGKYRETDVYEVLLWSEGALSFNKDVKNCIARYNDKLLGFWHKDKEFDDKIRSIDTLVIKQKKEAEYFRNKIIEILSKRKTIILGDLARELNINEDRMYYLLKSLRINNKIENLKFGEYSLIT